MHVGIFYVLNTDPASRVSLGKDLRTCKAVVVEFANMYVFPLILTTQCPIAGVKIVVITEGVIKLVCV